MVIFWQGVAFGPRPCFRETARMIKLFRAEVVTMKSYDKSTNVIDAKVGEIFSVELESIPGAGYQWDADFDGQKVEIVKKEFAPPPTGAIGGSGKDVFKFKPLVDGDTELRFVYKRPWETESSETFHIKMRAK
jgi:predicted secreted protein